MILAGAGGALLLLALTIRRPALACALLALAIPLTAGMARGAVTPLLRVNEALLLVVALGLLVNRLVAWRPLAYTALDVVVLGFGMVNVLVPTAVLLLSRADAGLNDWLVVVGPVQYLLVYFVYSRTDCSDAERRLVFNACMVASLVVAAVAIAQALDVGGVRGLLSTYYPTAPQPSWDPIYRPSSLLGHYSAVGAFGLLNLLLALALAGARLPGFPDWWLALVIGVNLVAVVAAQTYAPIAALPIGAVAVVLVVRRIPWRALAGVAVPALLAGSVALWPAIDGRLGAQFSATASSTGGSLVPETLQTRIDFWQGFFVPALLQHGVWFGTGTLMPPEVPRPLVDFVDNGYLWQLFRAGLPGLAMLVVMLAAVAAAAWATRTGDQAPRRALGAVCLGGVISVLLLDTTSEYLTFTAVSQEFWMLVGLLTGTGLATRSTAAAAARRRAPARGRLATIAAVPHETVPLRIPAVHAASPNGSPGTLRAALGRLGPGWALVRASGAVLMGFALARALGFLFQVVSGRVLSPVGYGELTYALAVANVAAVLLTTAPLGLSRFLSRSADRRPDQQAYYVNWLAVVGVLLGASAIAAAVLASPAGLGGWLLAGLLANLVGVAALETYREVQRGLGRYTLQSVFYVLANGLQLVVVLIAAGLDRASPELFLIVYGLSSVAALVAVAPASRGLGIDIGALRWRRMTRIAGFMRPVLLQAIFWNVWFNVDLILLLHLRGAAETGTYGAAKAIANGFTLLPTAIAFVFAPRVARLAVGEVRGQLLRTLALTLAVTVPLAITLMAVAGPLTGALFGGRYAAAAVPLVVLLAGMVPYGLKSVLGSLWLGLGHPVVETASSAAGMALTLAMCLWLVPQAGAVGAAVAFSAGALAMFLVDAAVTAWAFGASSPRVGHLSDAHILEEEPIGEGRPVLMVAEELGSNPDEGYVSFVRAVHTRLGGRVRVVLHASRHRRWHGHPVGRMLSRGWQVLRASRRPHVRAGRPAAVVYASRSSVTLPALLRGRLLKRLCGDAPLVFVALQSSPGMQLRGWLLRALAPDLLLLPTDRERDMALARGILAATVSSGVDLERFRPPAAGERSALRQKWELPADDRIVLHVGHLREGRNLGVMAAIAARPGVTAVVAASSWRGPESDWLRRQLEAAGVRVIDGYVPNVEELFRLADCYVFPTVLPGSAVALPLSILEAMASDLPVVSAAFGALSERFGGVDDLELVEDPAALPQRALARCGSAVRTRQLVEPYAWDAVAGRLASLLDELRRDHDPDADRGAGLRRVGRARLRRSIVARRDLPRGLLVGAGPGYLARPASTTPVELVEAVGARPEPGSPANATAAVVVQADDSPLSSITAAAGLLGVPFQAAAEPGAQKLVDRALGERWPLVALPLGALDAVSPAALCAYVGLGGTLYLDGLDGLDARVNPALRRLGESLAVSLPEVREAPAGRHLLVPGQQAAFGGVLAGARLAADCGEHALAPVADDEVLAWRLGEGPPSAAVVQRRVREGRVVLSVLRPPADDRLVDAMASNRAAGLVVPLLLLRELYGASAWHAPVPLANFTVDDPALRAGPLGLRYDILAAQAREHGFHVTIATVPRELPLADEAVLRRLREHPELLSACYHGCDHDGYEFFLTAGRWTRRRSRSLQEQRAALWRAIDHGHRFAAARRYRLDRVMVFPYGIGPASLFGDLHRLGFLATCNLGDKYPLEAPVPDEPDLGMRPADLAWEGFPLLWRRRLGDDGYLLDLLLGRPALLFAHPRALGRDFAPLVERARSVDRATRGRAVWRSLDEVARHAYLQRRDPRLGWQVLMTANEACLHNPDPEPRTYTVTRPHLPEGSVLDVGGRAPGGVGPIRVDVPAGGTIVLRVLAEGVAPLASRSGCTVFGPQPSSPAPDHLAAIRDHGPPAVSEGRAR